MPSLDKAKIEEEAMDQAFEERIHKALDRRERDRRLTEENESPEVRELRVAHDRVVAEIPGALERLSAAIDEMNDAVSPSGVHFSLSAVEELHTIEASFHVAIWPSDDRELVFNVSHDGKLIVLLGARQSRLRINARDIRQADRAFFLDAMVSLLEAAA
jgi:hypothetical protein